MYRVPSSRRRSRALKFFLATLLVLPALVFNGMTIFEDLVNAQHYHRPPELLIVAISVFAIFWALVLYAVVKYWPRWRALFLCAGLVLLDLASIRWWAYLSVHT
jgi:hypothetical protein